MDEVDRVIEEAEKEAAAHRKQLTAIQKEVERRFGFHPATPEVVPAYQAIREAFIDLAVFVGSVTPVSREQSLAMTALQEAQMWTIASIATNLTPVGEEGTGAR